LVLLFVQVPERHRGPAQAEFPQISVTKEGPLVIPAEMVIRGAIGFFSGYTAILIFVGRMVWKKREDELGDLKKGFASVTKALEETIDADTYDKERTEFRAMIAALNLKVDRHHDMITAKVDELHGDMTKKVDQNQRELIALLMETKERRTQSRE